MRVVVLAEGPGCRIVAELPDGGADDCDSDLELSFAAYKANGGSISKDVDRMLAVFAFMATRGRASSTHFFHEANKKHSIYEFKRGDLRVYFTFEQHSGQICLCSHAIRKKKDAADIGDIKKACAAQRRFTESVAAKSLKVVDRKKGKRNVH